LKSSLYALECGLENKAIDLVDSQLSIRWLESLSDGILGFVNSEGPTKHLSRVKNHRRNKFEGCKKLRERKA